MTTASASEETLVEAIARLRSEGYGSDFAATADGRLLCRACDAVCDPASMRIEHRVRFEGNSNPDDEAILLALLCSSGCRGLYSAAFGPDTPPEDAAVLRRLAQAATSSEPSPAP